MKREEVISRFKAIYGEGEQIRLFHSPGRVNLIGEYTDVNGGNVFPCALDFGTYAAVSKNSDRLLRLASVNFEKQVAANIKDIRFEPSRDWANYPMGVVKEILDMGKTIGGLNILFAGNIPNGAGLSSSASIEVLTGVILNEMFGLSIDMIELVKLSQRAENNFVGVKCGIMDQFAVGMGKRENAMLLDCNTLKYDYVPLKLGSKKIVIANTNKRRGLTDSKYNERRSECEAALKDLQSRVNISCLCALSNKEFDNISHLIKDKTNLKRATHAVYENNRVLEAVESLKSQNLEKFGLLLNASHKSLKELFEVSGFELDVLAEAAQGQRGCLGARMTGAGFGGCTVNIVEEDCIGEFMQNVKAVYKEKTGLNADIYIAGVGDGAKEV